MIKAVMPHLASALSSDTALRTKRRCYEITRKLTRTPHNLTVFLSISDPYSYLLVQVLNELNSRFAVNIQLVAVLDRQPEMFPRADAWQENAMQDARHLAELYQLDYPAHLSISFNPIRIEHYTGNLIKATQSNNAIDECLSLFRQFWSANDHNAFEAMSQFAAESLQINERYLEKLGHYQSAMIYFSGEWYWGLDRLIHLEQRLNELALNDNKPTIKYDRQLLWANSERPVSTSNTHSLTMYYSARSPYSYLGLERAVRLCQKYQCQLEVKPVLPMMMRGLPVPKSKKMYIFHDTKRQAKLFNIPYGKVADPLGKAVENCYALFEFASQQGKAIDFLLAFGKAVNSQGVFADQTNGLRSIVEPLGFDWQQVKPYLDNQRWRQWAAQNLQELSAFGLWGVPCFQYKQLVTWGQDRLWLIDQYMAN